MKLPLFSLALLLAAANAAAATGFSACGKAKSISALRASAAKLAKQREELETEVAGAQPVRCGKGLPMPAVHGKVQAYSRAMHGLSLKVRKESDRKKQSAACKKQLADFLGAQQADQRKLYERVEGLCRP